MSSQKTNIAYLIGSLRTGGAERMAGLVLNRLDSKYFNKHIIVLNDGNTPFKADLNSDIHFHSLNYRKRNALFSVYRLIRYLKVNRIHILHSHMYISNKIGAVAVVALHVPIFVTSEHGKELWKKWHNRLVEKYLINKVVSKRIAVSEDIRTLKIKYDGVDSDKIITIGNGTIMPETTNVVSGSPKVIGSVGRLVEEKDYPTLFKAVRIIIDKGFDIKLMIAGDGPKIPQLNKLIIDLELEKNVTLLGLQKADDFLKKIDIFVLSSISEGTPVALLEAMAHGIPVVATDVGGIPDIIRHGQDGFIVAHSSFEVLADTIICLINDFELRKRFAINARQRVVSKYSIENVVTRHNELYQQLISENREKIFYV